jgi:asparagine synthase (glutamine-hydrolysing)
VRQARKLPPAHILVYEDGRAVEKRYWGLDSVEFADSAQDDSFWELFEESVRLRLIADVPIGAFLSGGLDSSAVVAAAAPGREAPLETFTITFRGAGERRYDESAKAASVARAFSTNHHELGAEPVVDELLGILVRHFDEPFGNATALISHAVAGVTRQHVKVALDGAGGDELLAGYSRFRGALAMSRYRRVPAPVRSLVAAAAGALPESTRGRHGLRRAREFVRAPTSSLDDAYVSWITHFNGASREELLSPAVADALRGSDPPETFVRDLFDRAPREDIVNRMSFVDLQSYLPCNVLEYGDRMSMANSLEVRSPFVDHKLVEHVYALPGSAKLAGAQTKVLLRKELRSRVPETVLSSPKIGFNPPMGVWLRRELAPVVNSHLSGEQVAARGLLQTDTVERLVGTLRTGRRDVSQKVWALIVLEEWLRAYGHRVSVPS